MRPAAEKEWAQAEASAPLPPETREVLEDEHSARIGLLLKQAEVSARQIDEAYEAAKQIVERRTPALHVKRGAVYVAVEKAKQLKRAKASLQSSAMNGDLSAQPT
jgi:hypothetical protein